MNVINTLASSITTSTAPYSDIFYPTTVPCNYTTITSVCPTKLEADSNELKINIKKFQIKFNFNL